MDEAIEMGNARAFNMLVLGGILKVCPVVTKESIVNSLKESLAERLHKLIPENEKAILHGMEIIKAEQKI